MTYATGIQNKAHCHIVCSSKVCRQSMRLSGGDCAIKLWFPDIMILLCRSKIKELGSSEVAGMHFTENKSEIQFTLERLSQEFPDKESLVPRLQRDGGYTRATFD